MENFCSLWFPAIYSHNTIYSMVRRSSCSRMHRAIVAAIPLVLWIPMLYWPPWHCGSYTSGTMETDALLALPPCHCGGYTSRTMETDALLALPPCLVAAIPRVLWRPMLYTGSATVPLWRLYLWCYGDRRSILGLPPYHCGGYTYLWYYGDRCSILTLTPCHCGRIALETNEKSCNQWLVNMSFWSVLHHV